MVTSFMYLSMAIVFSAGRPFRKPFWTNWLLLLALIILYTLSLVIDLSNSVWFEEFFELIYWYYTYDESGAQIEHTLRRIFKLIPNRCRSKSFLVT